MKVKCLSLREESTSRILLTWAPQNWVQGFDTRMPNVVYDDSCDICDSLCISALFVFGSYATKPNYGLSVWMLAIDSADLLRYKFCSKSEGKAKASSEEGSGWMTRTL